MRWEILHDEFFENFNSLVRIVDLKFLYDDVTKKLFSTYRFDSMTDPHNEFMLFSHIGDEFIWCKTLIKCFAKHFRSTI